MGAPPCDGGGYLGQCDRMAFKLVVSDPKTRHSYQREVSEEGVLGKKIGEKMAGDIAGLEGYELEITGGSDKDGFPMRRDMEGTARKKILISAPPGFHPRSPGIRKRKSVRGNTISADIVQINTKVVKYGSKVLEKIFGTKKEGKQAEKPEEPKEEKAAEKAEEKAEEKATGKPEEKPAEEAKEEKTEERGAEEKVAEEKGEERPAKEETKKEKSGEKEEEHKKEGKPAEPEKEKSAGEEGAKEEKPEEEAAEKAGPAEEKPSA